MGIISEIEKNSLEAHVELCAERYEKMETEMERLQARMAKVETIVNDIKNMLIEKETMAYRKLIGIGIGIIGSLLTALLGIVMFVIKTGKF
jgi:hypothetical protein